MLRRPLGLLITAADVEDEDKQFHFAAIDAAGKVQGTVLVKPLTASLVKLRAMAVAQSFQGCGIGRELVQLAERTAQSHKFVEAELNARVSARGFYERLGYRAEGAEFISVGLPPRQDGERSVRRR